MSRSADSSDVSRSKRVKVEESDEPGHGLTLSTATSPSNQYDEHNSSHSASQLVSPQSIFSSSESQRGPSLNSSSDNENDAANDQKSSPSSSNRATRPRRKQLVWTPEEDQQLQRLVAEHGGSYNELRSHGAPNIKWLAIGNMMPGRTGKQCRERWHNLLSPLVNKDVWTHEEDKVIMHCLRTVGTRWSEIARYLPGRTDNAIKNRWYSTVRRVERYQKQGLNSSNPTSIIQSKDSKKNNNPLFLFCCSMAAHTNLKDFSPDTLKQVPMPSLANTPSIVQSAGLVTTAQVSHLPQMATITNPPPILAQPGNPAAQPPTSPALEYTQYPSNNSSLLSSFPSYPPQPPVNMGIPIANMTVSQMNYPSAPPQLLSNIDSINRDNMQFNPSQHNAGPQSWSSTWPMDMSRQMMHPGNQPQLNMPMQFQMNQPRLHPAHMNPQMNPQMNPHMNPQMNPHMNPQMNAQLFNHTQPPYQLPIFQQFGDYQDQQYRMQNHVGSPRQNPMGMGMNPQPMNPQFNQPFNPYNPAPPFHPSQINQMMPGSLQSINRSDSQQVYEDHSANNHLISQPLPTQPHQLGNTSAPNHLPMNMGTMSAFFSNPNDQR